MAKKDLAEKYAVEKYTHKINNVYIVKDNKCFTFEDLKAAFNAGLKSTVESIPDLTWKTLKDMSLKVITPFGCYNIDKNEYGFDSYIISVPSGEVKDVLGMQNAIQKANEDYKQRIKQALGL